MRWSPETVAAATDGQAVPPVGASGPASISGVTIDSRELAAGDLFVAIRAERDGHDFVAAAVAAGAGAVLVERLDDPLPVPAIVVKDTAAALLALGRAARDRLEGPVVGITGSVGKTSTKDLSAAALSAGRRTVASKKSFNNELGLPLTLANAPDDTEVAVLEMGARGPGHISLLCGIARPRLGVVTAVASAHTETFGSLEAIAEAKGELVEALPADGAAVLNADYDLVRAMTTRSAAPAILYSAAGDANADLVAEDVHLDAELRPSFVALTPWGRADIRLEARGAHQVGNALAALAVAAQTGVDLADAAGALADAQVSAWRLQIERTPAGATILNDAYNANPTSMAAGLRALAALPAPRRTAIVGFMAELGPSSAAEHQAVADLAASLGIRLIPVGTDLYGPGGLTVEQALDALGPISDGDAVLVKASRVAGLEVLADRLSRG